MKRNGFLQLSVGAIVLVLSGYFLVRGAAVMAWLTFVSGAVAVLNGVVLVYRSTRKDDTFNRFVAGALMSDPRSQLFCNCGHELHLHTFRDDELQCSRCDAKGLPNQCAISDPARPGG